MIKPVMKPVFRYSIVINLSRNTRKISPNINTCKKIYYSLNVTIENIRHILYNKKFFRIIFLR